MRKILQRIFEHTIAYQIAHYGFPFLGALLMTYWAKVNDIWPIPWPVAITIGLVCLTCLIVLVDKLLSSYKKSYTETKVRFVQSKGHKSYYESPELSNIYNWQQLVLGIGEYDKDNKPIKGHYYSVFFFIFDKPINYGYPQINAFGHDFPMHNYYAKTNRGIVLAMDDEIKAPIFEVYFPPIEKTSS